MDPLTPLQDPEPALQVDAFDAPAPIEVEVQPPPQQRPKLSRKEAGDLAVQEWARARLGAPKTAGEVFSDVGKNPSTLVPFLSSGEEAYHLYDLWEATQTPDEQRTTAQNDLLTAAAVEQGRDSTWGAKFADIVTQLPAFAGEFALTGGVYSLARKGAAKGMEKALGKTLTRLAGAKASELAVKGASVLAGATAQTIAMPTQVVNATLRAALPRIGISKDESGEIATVLEGSTRGFLEALPAGFSDALTETVSERTGGLVEMGTDALLKIRGLQLASIRRWVQSGNGRTWSDAAKKIKESTGWNGILGEFSEERIGAAMRAANPLLPDTWGQVWPGWEQASAELAAFAVPGAASRIAGKVLGRAKPAAATDGAPVATPAGAGPVVPTDGSSDLPVGSNEVPGAGPALPTGEPVEGSSDAGETSAVRPVPPPAWSEMPDLEGEPAPDAVEPDDDGQRAAAVLVRANRDRGYLEESDLQGARLVEPTNPLDVWGKEFLQVPMVMVDAGKPMRMSAVYTNGALALDARAAPAERVKAILFHELAHVTRATRRSSWQRWHADISAVDPEGMRLAEEEYASEFKTTAGRSLGPDARVDEGAARYVESIVGYLDLTLRDRQRAVRIATKNPGVFRSIIDGVRRLVNRLFETNIPLEVEKQARAWLAEADALVPGSQRGRSTSERAAALSPEQAARIALRTVEMFDSLAGPRRVATAPAGPINPSSGGGLTTGPTRQPRAGGRSGGSGWDPGAGGFRGGRR